MKCSSGRHPRLPAHLSIVGALLAALAAPASAFIPTNLKTVGGLLGTSHMKITEGAIKDLDNEFFGITKLTSSMEKAIEEINDAQVATDDDQLTAAKHCDGESFPEAQTRLIGLFNDVKSNLASENIAGARESLGTALHTIQDFYSHSNWVDSGNSSPHPGLGRPGSSIPRLPASTPTCQDCTGGLPPLLCPDCSMNLITTGLTSGYYGGESPPFGVKPAGKCSHGGITDSSATGFFGQGINKDSTDCEFSPRNFLHSAAVAVAKEATKQFIRDIKAAVTNRQIKQLLGVGPSLAMAIDTTGSMGGIIGAVQAQAISIVDSLIGTDDEPSRYVLTPFNDPFVGPFTVTSDPDVFKSALLALSASAGGDCPELALSGAYYALSDSDEGGDLFIFTDALAKDFGLAGAVSALAATKDIQIYCFVFGDCSERPAALRPSAVDPAFLQIARESGGQLFDLDPSEAGGITNLVSFSVRSDAVDLLSIADSVSGSPKTYPVPVDSTMTRVTFSVSGTPTVTVKRPGGADVLPSDSDVTFVALGTGVLVSVQGPAAGEWNVVVDGTAAFTLAVSGESPLDLVRFRFVEPGGRPGHGGFFPITGLPGAGEAGTLDARLTEGFDTAQFELRSPAGPVLQSLALTLVPETTDEFSGSVTPPAGTFFAYVKGLDVAGKPYQRLLTEPIEAQSVRIDAPSARDLAPDQTTSYVFKIKNLGTPGDFEILAAEDQGFLLGASPLAFSLGTNETIGVTVQLRPPVDADPALLSTLTVTVESATDPAIHNFALVRSGVAAMTVSGIEPASGPAIGGTPVTISGIGFAPGASVTFAGGAAASGVSVPGSTEIDATTPALAPGTLNDVTVTNPSFVSGTLPEIWFADFLDVSQAHSFHDFVERLFRNRVTSGCGAGNYCPEMAVTRGQMAVFLLRGEHGSTYLPPPATGIFSDVPISNPFAAWIEQLFHEGITVGCGGGKYCPASPVTREQMAVFLLRALFGSAFSPAPATGIFSDVPVSSPFARWIERLFLEKITSGCGAGVYCPGSPNTRGQMAVFLSRTFLGTPALTVNAPAGIAGAYPAGPAEFGQRLTFAGVTADVVLADDGLFPATDACTSLTPDNAAEAAGKILLVDRGNCAFTTKVKNGQNAAAIGVIVADNVAGGPPAPLPGNDPSITIPSLRITLEDGATLKANLPGVNATLGTKISSRGALVSSGAAAPPAGRPTRLSPAVVSSLGASARKEGAPAPGQ